jgi:hypothetical protein
VSQAAIGEAAGAASRDRSGDADDADQTDGTVRHRSRRGRQGEGER